MSLHMQIALTSEPSSIEALLATIPGSAALVFLITSSLSKLTDGKIEPQLKWISFVASMVLAFAGGFAFNGGDAATTNNSLVSNIFLAFFNGLAIFLASVGGNTVANANAGQGTLGGSRGSFFAPWFRPPLSR